MKLSSDFKKTLPWVCGLFLLASHGIARAGEQDLANLQLRVKGYLQTMLDGKKTSLVRQPINDYYPRVYLVNQAEVVEVKEVQGEHYEAVFKFETQAIINQSIENSPMSIKKEEQILNMKEIVRFDVTPEKLVWQKRLDAPFVTPGNEKRYLLEK